MRLPFQNRRSLNATKKAAASGQPVCQTPSKLRFFSFLCMSGAVPACGLHQRYHLPVQGDPFFPGGLRRDRDLSGRAPVHGFPARARQNAIYLPDPLHHNIGLCAQDYDVKFSIFCIKTGGGCRGSDTYFRSPVARIARKILDNYDGGSSGIPGLWHGLCTCPTPSRPHARGEGFRDSAIHTYNGPVNPFLPITTERLLLFVPAIPLMIAAGVHPAGETNRFTGTGVRSVRRKTLCYSSRGGNR